MDGTAWHLDDLQVGDLNKSELPAGGTHVLCLFCALRNLSDCARREMLHTEFRRDGLFRVVRALPVDVRNLVVGYVGHFCGV